VLVLAALVLLGHATLLGLLPRVPAVQATPGRDRAAPMQVRQLAAAARDATGGTEALDEHAAAAPQALATGPARPAPGAAPTEPAAAPQAALQARPQAPSTAPASLSAEPTVPAAPGAAPEGGQLPIYATHLPPPATLRYALQRGAARGSARLTWAVQADTYQLTLQGMASGSPAIERSSQGGLDAAGIAPLRFAESRRGRELRAANFQREAQRITFSGPAVVYPLVPGSQDRLSWALQLAAVLAANPALAAPGAQVVMFVAGTRGDANVWTFTVQGSETLQLPAGTVGEALHLLREPQGPYDTRAEAWLDPARHHLPVRLRMQVPALGEGTDLQLESMTLP
jgi:hypothetical protein